MAAGGRLPALRQSQRQPVRPHPQRAGPLVDKLPRPALPAQGHAAGHDGRGCAAQRSNAVSYFDTVVGVAVQPIARGVGVDFAIFVLRLATIGKCCAPVGTR